ncbi:MAG TPA: STAS domain-containing protein [Steroidobacteraceae bacterium]|nr:STAS domain-containing protein [Steroidobacteraceae bacterium]
MSATLEAVGTGRFRVSGVLDASTTPALLEQSKERFTHEKSVDVDFAQVTESDSAGMALLIEWMRLARRQGQKLRFSNIPAQIAALARISEVDDLLAGAEHELDPNATSAELHAYSAGTTQTPRAEPLRKR